MGLLSLLHCCQLPRIRSDRAAESPVLFELDGFGVATADDRVGLGVDGVVEQVGVQADRDEIFAVLSPHFADLALAQGDVLHAVYQDPLTSIERKPLPSLEALRNIRRLMAAHTPKAANVKVEELIDARLIRKLDGNGYMDRVAASYGLK